MNKLNTIHDGQNDATRNSLRGATLRNGATKNRIRWTNLRRNETPTKRTYTLSFDWRRAISYKDYPAALQSRVDSISLILLFPPGEQSLPGDGRRTRLDHLAWLTGAALWLCFRLVHLFYMKDIPRPAQKDKPGVSPRTGFVAESACKEVFRYISTTGNFLGAERVESKLRIMRQSYSFFGVLPVNS